MKTRRILPFLLLLALCGCFQVKDELTIDADGSGRVHLEVKNAMPASMAGEMSMAGGFGGAIALYPPFSDDEAHRFFPAKDFTVQVKTQPAADGNLIIIDASFKNINALLASPYGKAHQLSLSLAGQNLTLKAVSGLEGLARVAETKDIGGNDMEIMAMPGLAEARKKTNEMRFEFHVTLPNDLETSSGHHEGKTASWLAERAKSKDSDDFAGQLGAIMEASCPATGLKMSPNTPPRLALGGFKDLQDQSVAAATPPPDTNKIAAAVRFVPATLVSTRTMDLTGANNAPQQNAARLTGALVLPVEFAPQKWGEPEIEEVTDAAGNSLVLEKSAENQFMFQDRFSGMQNGDEDAVPAREARHKITLAFRPPDWKVKEISKIKATVGLTYFGGSQLVKISNAIPANWIVEMKDGQVDGLNGGEKPISQPKLPELGVSLALSMAMKQGGMIMLSMQMTASKSTLLDMQVFDAEGRPWPTIIPQNDGAPMNDSYQVMVLGLPKAPLSLALLFSGAGGVNVKAPIVLEHVPLRGE